MRRNPTPVMHLPVTGNIYLLDDDVFALDINLLRCESPAIRQTIEWIFFSRFAKTQNVISAYLSSPPLGLLSVLFVFLFMYLRFLALK